LLALASMMGHRSIKTTIEKYLRWLPDTNSQIQINQLRIALFNRFW
jgi:hypothetical protein